jgi:hypothetical protein
MNPQRPEADAGAVVVEVTGVEVTGVVVPGTDVVPGAALRCAEPLEQDARASAARSSAVTRLAPGGMMARPHLNRPLPP